MPRKTRSIPSLPTGHVTFLFTDIEGSTALWERQPEAMQLALARHDTLLRENIEAHAGHIVKSTGDGVLAVFDRPTDALGACVAVQRALQAPPPSVPADSAPDAADPLELRVRMALHTGTAELRNGDYFGLALSRAARLMSAAHGQQILMSAATADLLREHLPSDVSLRELGAHRLKGLQSPESVMQVVAPGLRAGFPPLVMSNGALAAVGDARIRTHSLPLERDVFIGRAAEIAALGEHVASGVRLITLSGPGGAGKTRIARRYGWSTLADWPGGVWFADLSEARTLEGIAIAVASVLDVPLRNDQPETVLGRAIAGRGQCLVILDNFEQIVAHAKATVGRWLALASQACFVVTSRERLGLAGERVMPVDPLPFETEAVDLFTERAREQRPDFRITDANRTSVARLVRLLEGHPLAIELAAARIRVLTPMQIVERMGERFKLLADGRRDVARQSTLRATIEWSWQLLAGYEQAALAQCAVFDGAFTLDAAESVIELSAFPDAPATLDVVHALVDKSLLRAWTPADDAGDDFEAVLFGLFVSIRDFAAERLQAMGEAARYGAEERHGRFFARFGSVDSVEAMSSHGSAARLRALRRALDNLVTACRRAVGRRDADTAMGAYIAASLVLDLQGPASLNVALGELAMQAGRASLQMDAGHAVRYANALRRVGRDNDAIVQFERLQRSSAAAGCRRDEVIALTSLGNLLRDQHREQEADTHYQNALAVARAIEYRRGESQALCGLGVLRAEQRRFDEARAHWERAAQIACDIGDRTMEAVNMSNLGALEIDLRNVVAAEDPIRRAIAINLEIGNRREEAIARGNLGNIARELGRFDDADTAYAEALTLIRQAGDRRFEAILLMDVGRLYQHHGNITDASTAYAGALAIYQELGDALLAREAEAAREAIASLAREVPAADHVDVENRPG